jgi:vacuolar-type H+-ATPase subunit E/Vma4
MSRRMLSTGSSTTCRAIRGVAAVYNRHAYLDERRAALEAWSQQVESIVRPVESNVVPLAATG